MNRIILTQKLGICADSLKTWLKNAKVLPQTASAQNKDIQRLKDLEAENKALRKALAEKTEAVEILIPKGQRKKSVGIILKP